MHRLPHVLAVSSLVGACTADEPTSRDYEQAAQVLGSLSANVDAGELHALFAAQVLGTGGVPGGFTVDASGQVAGASAGISYTLLAECRDASQVLQPACGPATETADVEVTWTGALSVPHLTAQAGREGHVRLADLTSNVTTVDGGGAFALDATLESWLESRTTQLRFEIASSYDQLHLSTFPAALIDGTIRYTVDAREMTSGRPSRSVSLDAELTITPALLGAEATLVLDGTETFGVELQTGRIFRR